MNYTHIAIAGVVAFFFGWLWHGPLFGNLWMKLAGIQKPASMTPEMKKQMLRSMLLGLLINLVTAGVLSYFITATSTATLAGAITVAALAWLGFTLTSMASPTIWEGRSVKLYLFNVAYQLVATIVIAVVLALLA